MHTIHSPALPAVPHLRIPRHGFAARVGRRFRRDKATSGTLRLAVGRGRAQSRLLRVSLRTSSGTYSRGRTLLQTQRNSRLVQQRVEHGELVCAGALAGVGSDGADERPRCLARGRAHR